MCKCHCWDIFICFGLFRKNIDKGIESHKCEIKRFDESDSVSVIEGIHAGCTKVDYSSCLWALGCIGLDLGHEIVMNHVLDFCGLVDIDVILMSYQLLYLFLCDDSSFLLGFGKSNPDSSQKFPFVNFREDFFHFL